MKESASIDGAGNIVIDMPDSEALAKGVGIPNSHGQKVWLKTDPSTLTINVAELYGPGRNLQDSQDDKQNDLVSTSVRTQDVINSFLLHKKHEGVGDETKKTYEKRLCLFARQYPILPLETMVIMEYLGQFDGKTRRHKRNQQDLLNMFYNHALLFSNIEQNPLKNLKRPRVTKLPINTLSIAEARKADSVTCTTTERAAWELAFGHGWRQIEVRRVTAGDVRSISDGVIWCRGKERDEYTPLLPETQELLEQLAEKLADDEPVIRSTRIRAGSTQPLGPEGMSQLLQRIFHRACIKYLGHDLRRTFCTMAREASGDEFLAMRLARDIIPGVSDRYIKIDPVQLRGSLLKYSPVRLIRHEQTGESLVETGEGRTPRPEETTQNLLQV